MRGQAVLPVLMITLLLSACGGKTAAEERLEARRETLAAAGELRFQASVTADVGGEEFRCLLDCAATAEETAVEVLEPELISGIRAVVQAGETSLRYEDVQLAVGAAGAEDGSPLSIAPLLVKALREGHIIRAWAEQEDAIPLLAGELYVDDRRTLELWFRAEDLVPVQALLSEDGREILRCEIREFHTD